MSESELLTYKRWQKAALQKALKTRRVIVLAGARQCGKTTLVQHLCEEDSRIIYRTLDDTTLLDAALNDPQGFVAHDDQLMIIDEAQRAPMLLQAIKQNVDNNKAPGRFLLTGSANIQSLPGVTESLAGRIRKIRLRPLAMGEIAGVQSDFLKRAFAGKLQNDQTRSHQNHLNKYDYIRYALQGGYPEPRLLDARENRRWHQDYIAALIERDLKDIVNIRRTDSMYKLLEVLAAWSSKRMDIAAIGSNLSLSRPTIEAYINALEALYLVDRLRPWSKTDYDRTDKRDRLFMTDTGLMASMLQWEFNQIHLDGERNGKLIESFVFNQLSAIIDAQDEEHAIYYYRDRTKREIDFLIEHEDGSLLGIEVKAGSMVNKDSFKHLSWFAKSLPQDRSFTSIVLYTGEHTLSLGKNQWAVPISALWEA